MKSQNMRLNSTKELTFLILSCSGGAGHLRAAEALHKTAPLTGLPIKTLNHDVLDFTSKLFKKLYSETYLKMVNKSPELWGYLYQLSEKKPYNKKNLIKTFDKLNYRKYIKYIKSINPDAIICTHFLPYISISDQLKKHNINIPIFAVTTDYDVHQLWVDKVVKRYFVFHEESAWLLNAKNIQMDNIVVSGIPVLPQFSIQDSTTNARKKIGVDKNNFTILALSGGFGIGRIKDIVNQIISTTNNFKNKKFNLLIVCGKNAKALAEINSIVFPNNINKKIFGFVDNIHELMDASDILISKAGGLTSSEAMAKSLPMLIIDPIPGQESRNTDLITEYGAGWKAINLAHLSFKLKRVIENPKLLNDAKKNTKKLAKPNAAKFIINNVYNCLMENYK